MLFKKRFLMVFCTVALLAGMLGGGSVAAAEGKLNYETVVKMDKAELAAIPQSQLAQLIDEIAKLSETDIKQLDRAVLERIANQWLENSYKEGYLRVIQEEQSRILTLDSDTIVQYGQTAVFTTASVSGEYLDLVGFANGYSYGSNANKKNYVSAQALGGYGISHAWAYNGSTFTINGGSGPATADIAGSAKATFAGLFAWLEYRVIYELYDYNVGAFVANPHTAVDRGYFAPIIPFNTDDLVPGHLYYNFENNHTYSLQLFSHANASSLGTDFGTIQSNSEDRCTVWSVQVLQWV